VSGEKMGKNNFYHRVLLKISGEAFLSRETSVISVEKLNYITDELLSVRKVGIELALVLGGGNIIRGVNQATRGFDRVRADYMGMLATLINSLALQDILERRGVLTRVMSSIEIARVVEPIIRSSAIRYLENGEVVIFAGGTGNPYFSTDTAAVIRAQEVKAQVFLKATKVDGIYSADPMTTLKSKKFMHLTYNEILTKRLKVMDSTAISLADENKLPIIVFDFMQPGNIIRVLKGKEMVGSSVKGLDND